MLTATFESLRKGARELARATGAQRTQAMLAVAARLRENASPILAANAQDLREASSSGMKEALLDRLRLDETRIEAMACSIETTAALPDPIGRVEAGWTRPNGLFIEKVTVPLGVAAIIYESRPNVTAEAWALAYKAGCAILLRGSSAALHSNRAVVDAIMKGLATGGGVPVALGFVCGDRSEVDEILAARGKIDVLLPRGGRSLIRHVTENARVPVIETGEGNCHIYVDASFVTDAAGVEAALSVIDNAKNQKPGACNACETLLVQEEALPAIMRPLASLFAGKCELLCDEPSLAAVSPRNHEWTHISAAQEAAWETEFLDRILAVKTVSTLEEAIAHINRYGTGHSEAILTRNLDSARRFQEEVDAACVYVNASTRFTDGGEFGFGAELGISTQKLHARGPMGLSALTTVKYRVTGANPVSIRA